MKVLLVDPFVSGHHVLYAKKIINYLIKNNVEVSFMTSEKFSEELNINVIKLPEKKYKCKSFNKINEAIYYDKILELIEKNNIDIVHLLYLDNQSIPLILAIDKLNKISKKAKLIGTIHWYSNIIGYNGLKRKIKTLLFKYLKNKFALFFVHGQKNKDMLIKTLNLNECKIATIPYGANRFIEVDKESCRKVLHINQEEKVILLFGAIRDDKGIDILVRSTKYLVEEITILIAGKVNEFVDLVKSLSSHENVTLRLYDRFIKEDEIQTFYGASDVVVLPYKKTFTGQSGPLALATQFGTPVIGTEVGEIGMTIRQNNLGIVIEPEKPKQLANAINKFFSISNAELSLYKENLIKYNLANLWDVMSEHIYNYYCKIVKS
jgi:glycosyltransferase involved in cell wall biosynthesis